MVLFYNLKEEKMPISVILIAGKGKQILKNVETIFLKNVSCVWNYSIEYCLRLKRNPFGFRKGSLEELLRMPQHAALSLTIILETIFFFYWSLYVFCICVLFFSILFVNLVRY